MIQRAIRTRSSSRRSTRSSSRSSPARPGLAPRRRPSAGSPPGSQLGLGEQPLLGRRGEQRRGGPPSASTGARPSRADRRARRRAAGRPGTFSSRTSRPSSYGPAEANGPRDTRARSRPRTGAAPERPPAAAGPRAPLGLAVRIEHGALRADRALGDEAVVAAERGTRGTSESSLARLPPCRAMRTAVISDLHLGALTEADMRAAAPARSSGWSTRSRGRPVVLLGDTLELRERPLAAGAGGGAPAVRASSAPRSPASASCWCRATTTTSSRSPGSPRLRLDGGRCGAENEWPVGAGRRRRRGARGLAAAQRADARLSRPAAARRTCTPPTASTSTSTSPSRGSSRSRPRRSAG